ncbi:hypothetical protein [Roseivivax marinus]|uniref:hypothetical protein n=1 Tax=Roseivivax marinus TaxID=1379903 RepID=UPI00273DA066|nr:hypothetical protein [Roseivivax marinus]
MTNELPDLNGTQKQVACATDIRAASLENWRRQIDCMPRDLPTSEKRIECAKRLVALASNNTDADHWINARYDGNIARPDIVAHGADYDASITLTREYRRGLLKVVCDQMVASPEIFGTDGGGPA